MALKGKPRDMNKWREVLLDPNVHFPGESSEYRRTRNELLEAEAARIWRTLSRKRTCRTCQNWLRHNPNPNRDERTVSVDGKSAP
jgi:hypothetical protein